jgi:hypothetical protein
VPGPPQAGRCYWPARCPCRRLRRTWSTGIGRIDASGRIADRTVTSALGWRGGDRLTLTADAGVVTARRDPGGMVTRAGPVVHHDSRRAAPPLRPAARRPVLLAAVPGDDTLTAYSLAVVDQAIRAHGALPHAQGGQQP